MVEANIRVFVFCMAALYVKMLGTLAAQSKKTFLAGNRPPEDAKLSIAKRIGVRQDYGATPAAENDAALLKARELDARWKRIVMNDLESIPIALLVFGGGILAGSNSTVHSTALVLFTLFRFIHTMAYAKSLQPLRARAWFGGVLCTLVGVGNAVAAVL